MPTVTAAYRSWIIGHKMGWASRDAQENEPARSGDVIPHDALGTLWTCWPKHQRNIGMAETRTDIPTGRG
jgi:hypothetical protein